MKVREEVANLRRVTIESCSVFGDSAVIVEPPPREVKRKFHLLVNDSVVAGHALDSTIDEFAQVEGGDGAIDDALVSSAVDADVAFEVEHQTSIDLKEYFGGNESPIVGVDVVSPIAFFRNQRVIFVEDSQSALKIEQEK